MQKLWIKIGNLSLKLTDKYSENKKNRMILILFSVYILLFLAFDSIRVFGIDISNAARAIIDCCILFPIIVFSIKDPLKKVKNNTISIAWLICGGLILITAIDHPIGFSTIASGVAMLTVFPFLFLVWKNRGDYETLFKLYSQAYVWVILLCAILCLIFAPLGQNEMYGLRYMGITANPNYLALFVLPGFVCGLYLYITSKKRGIVPLFACGAAFALTFFTMFRTSLIAMILQLALVMLIMAKEFYLNNKDKRRIIIKKMLLLAFTLMLSIPIVYGGLTYGNTAIWKALKTCFNIELPAVTNQTTLEERTIILDKEFKMQEGADYSNLRITIWKEYLKRINIRGNDVTKSFYIPGFGENTSAHNDFLEYTYRSGIIVGMLYLFIAIYAGVKLLQYVFGNGRQRKYLLFFALMVTGFCVVSMLGNTHYILSGALTFSYCMSLVSIFFTEKNVEICSIKEYN